MSTLWPTWTTIVADPPWPFEWTGGGAYRTNGRGERHLNHKFKKGLGYTTMSIEAIAAMRVSELAAGEAHLYLWIPDCHLIAGHGQRVVEAWGFEPCRTLVWDKIGYALGRFPRPQHEALIVCRRGGLPFDVADVGSVQRWSRVYEDGAPKHSAKPPESLDLIERASRGPYLELFARRHKALPGRPAFACDRAGWSVWGDEVESDPGVVTVLDARAAA